ncbi:MFS transporter [Croceicoccus estronivorus]|uniref:NnrU family protein n=1 Tax=Croceicoccus estronivorus TaxID=1172626 RepID=UPI000835B231|nr:NnrU family protein [Croceicoccus estronivorus]OCC23912.1 MFS transporter [Croceicoccus estronivorus]
MEAPLISLLAACIAFVGSHFVMSHPLRSPLADGLGDRLFLALYSLVSLVTFAWVVIAFRAAYGIGAPAWNGQTNLAWGLASLLTLFALLLFLGSLRGNPAAPETPPAKIAAAQPRGAYAVTRHPMMWGFALWAVAHILIMPTPRSVILCGAILILALLGAHLQDRKKEMLLGAAWKGWEAQTSYWPQWGKLVSAGWGLWALTVILWLAITWLHFLGAGINAGVWRWY